MLNVSLKVVQKNNSGTTPREILDLQVLKNEDDQFRDKRVETRRVVDNLDAN